MTLDWYTKAVLTVIALALVGNLLKPVLTPPTVQVAGEGKFEHLQASIGVGGPLLFDTKTGDLWLYNFPDGTLAEKFKLVELGKSMQVVEFSKQLQKMR
jgi:hypothetical protein